MNYKATAASSQPSPAVSQHFAPFDVFMCAQHEATWQGRAASYTDGTGRNGWIYRMKGTSCIRQKWDDEFRRSRQKEKKGKKGRILKTKKNLRMMMVLEQADVGGSV